MRSRDIKHKLATLYTVQDREEAQRIENQLKALARMRRKQARRQAEALANPENPPPPPPGGLKRGPKPNPFRDKCEHGWHVQLTSRESEVLAVLWKQFAPHATRSTFLRWILCDFLEKHRRKDCPTMPFGVDLNALDERQKGRSERREAPPDRPLNLVLLQTAPTLQTAPFAPETVCPASKARLPCNSASRA